MSKSDNCDFDKQINLNNDELLATRAKLDRVLELVKRTFTGCSEAAIELSNLVGVPPPILCKEDNEKQILTPRISNELNKRNISTEIAVNKKLNNRLEFLNQVMSEHETMINGDRCVSQSENRKRIKNTNNNVRTRARSADRGRLFKLENTKYSNPYTWNLNDHMDYEQLFKLDSSVCQGKPILSKNGNKKQEAGRSKSTAGYNTDSSDVKVEHFLFNSGNQRNQTSHHNVRPHADFQMVPQETKLQRHSVNKPPLKPERPLTSSVLNYRHLSNQQRQTEGGRKQSSRRRLGTKDFVASRNGNDDSTTATTYQSLTLQNMNGLQTEQLLREMERRFELSTIELQRKLGISQDGMVGL